MSETEIKVPNIGDFKDVEVIEVLVSEGQILQKNDPIITIESDKSSVEIPSNFEGKIKSLKIKVGDKISEGDLILILEETSTTKENTEEKPNIEKELKKIPFFVRGKARRNTETYATSQGLSEISVDTLYEAKAFYAR